MFRALLRLGLLCLIIDAASLPAGETEQPQILVFAASSLTDVLREIGAGYEKTAGVQVKFSFDATSNLIRQIQAGAPADVFFSADCAVTAVDPELPVADGGFLKVTHAEHALG